MGTLNLWNGRAQSSHDWSCSKESSPNSDQLSLLWICYRYDRSSGSTHVHQNQQNRANMRNAFNICQSCSSLATLPQRPLELFNCKEMSDPVTHHVFEKTRGRRRHPRHLRTFVRVLCETPLVRDLCSQKKKVWHRGSSCLLISNWKSATEGEGPNDEGREYQSCIFDSMGWLTIVAFWHYP